MSLGAVGVAGSIALWTLVSSNSAFAYTGGFLLAALATAFILVGVVCAQGSVLSRCLSVPPLRYLGRISYGMYLWHWPLFLYIDGARTGLTGYGLFVVRVLVTIIVATVSFYVVERPIRRGGFLGAGVHGWWRRRRWWRRWWPCWLRPSFPPWPYRPVRPRDRCAPADRCAPTGRRPIPARSVLARQPPVRVLIVGDSAALTLAIGLDGTAGGLRRQLARRRHPRLRSDERYRVPAEGNRRPYGARVHGQPRRPSSGPRYGDELIARWHPDVVMILAGRWEVSNRTYEGRWTDILDPVYAAYVEQQLAQAVLVAGSAGRGWCSLTAPCDDSGEQPDGDRGPRTRASASPCTTAWSGRSRPDRPIRRCST